MTERVHYLVVVETSTTATIVSQGVMAHTKANMTKMLRKGRERWDTYRALAPQSVSVITDKDAAYWSTLHTTKFAEDMPLT